MKTDCYRFGEYIFFLFYFTLLMQEVYTLTQMNATAVCHYVPRKQKLYWSILFCFFLFIFAFRLNRLYAN